jgi:hypothetical protein
MKKKAFDPLDTDNSTTKPPQEGIQRLLSTLDGVQQTDDCERKAPCPAHDDEKPSLSISVEDTGNVLVHCHADCKTPAVLGPVSGPEPPNSSGTDLSQLEQICKDLAAKYAPAAATGEVPGPSPIRVALSSPWIGTCFVANIAGKDLAAFLNKAGQQTKAAGISDVQVWLQDRHTTGNQLKVQHYGIIIDIDKSYADLLQVFEDAGLPQPNVIYQTTHGHRALFLFDQAVDKRAFEFAAKKLVLNIRGADCASWQSTQGQHLPICIKTVRGQKVDVDFPAIQVHANPLKTGEFLSQLTPGFRKIIAPGSTLSADERKVVENYLSSLGIPAPDQPGALKYPRCPDGPHSNCSCQIVRKADGTVDARCYGGHDNGSKAWTEVDLLARATKIPAPEVRFNPLTDLPVTWSTIEFLQQQFGMAFANEPRAHILTKAAIEVWVYAHACYEVKLWIQRAKAAGEQNPIPPTVTNFLAVYRKRLYGSDGAGVFRLMYDKDNKSLRLVTNTATIPLRVKGDSLSPKAHYHEIASTTAYTVVGDAAPDEDFRPLFGSLFNKALAGHQGCLRELGIPIIQRYEHPVAFVKEGWTVDAETKIMTAVQTVKTKDGDPEFDVVAYFTGLFKSGRLPFAGEPDVLRYLMSLAAPFLRHVAPGLLGVFWFIGPTGAGKDFLIEMATDIWRAVSGGRVGTKFDLNCHDDLELKRSFSQATNALFCRVKEAGKRELINSVIRLAATDVISARGMRQDEVLIENRFVYMADSLEDLPNRKEVARRTVVINVERINSATVSLGAVRAEVLAHSADIVAGLKRLVETNPAEWYLQRQNVGLRPVGQAALAELFNVELPEVEGRNLDDLMDAIVTYVDESGRSREEGEAQRSKARSKDGREMQLFNSYRLSHFMDIMKKVEGFGQLFRDFHTVRSIHLALQRELDYADVTRGRLPYLRIEHCGRALAFKLVRDGQSFVLESELKFCEAMGIVPIGPVTTESSSGPFGPRPIGPPRLVVPQVKQKAVK